MSDGHETDSLSDGHARRAYCVLPRPTEFCQGPLPVRSELDSRNHPKLVSTFIAPTYAWLRGDNKRIELTRPNRDGAYQPHRD